MTYDDFIGKKVIIRDVTGCCFEGIYRGSQEGMIPEMFASNCRQINYQDAKEGTPMACEWWEVGDQVFTKHHVVGMHLTNLKPR